MPIPSSSAERRAAANFLANCSALAHTQPDLAQSVLPPRQQVEWVFGRDGFLTALDEQGDWWSGCSLPRAAGMAMLEKMDVHSPVACFLAPPHAAQIRVVLDKFEPEQAIIAVVPEENDVRLILSCEDFSKDINSHRVWIAAGPNWAAMLESILTEQLGLAVAAQFVRLHSTDETLIQNLIREATEVFSRITIRRSEAVRQLSESQSSPRTEPRRFCVMAPKRFRLWNDEGLALSRIAPANSMLIDTSDPALSSPLKLAKEASGCGALLTPNFARADLPNALPLDLPWFTWITNDRVPAFNLAGPNDRLLIVADSVQTAAIAAGWPADRVHLAGWPEIDLPAAVGQPTLAVIADTVPVSTPADLEDFSSHRVLWETIQSELTNNPLSLDSDPGSFLTSRMSRFGVSTDSFPQERFLTQLIVPAYQQSMVRLLVKAGLPVRLFGTGWSEIAEFQTHAAGLIGSQAELESASASATALVDLWPWRAVHPIAAAGRPVVRRDGRNLSTFIQRARNALAGRPTNTPPASVPLSTKLLADLLLLPKV
jgi:hypothetical protein